MKRKRIFLLFLALIPLGIACLVLVYYSPFNFLFPPLKPNCLPIDYPNGSIVKAENGVLMTYTVPKTMDELVPFFEQKLKDPKNKNRLWGWKKTGTNDILFECVSAASAYEAERGCIHFKKVDNTTIITSVWSHYPDAAPLCNFYLHDLSK